MSLKCSILGHRFGDPVVERSRDESGSEVVITIQEVQTCDRCGDERVVSENKEVTTLETPDTPPDASATAEAETPAESSAGAADDGTVLEDEPPVSEAEPAAATAGTGPDLGAVEEEPDDGVILEEEEADDDPDRDPGAWPEEPGDDGPEWTPPTEAEDPAEPASDHGPTVEPTGEALTVPEGRFRCPACGFTTPVDASSLREGDFCPECHTGSLAHERGTE
jgi:ssDNA-binding Zn-finger/Zn-ribbon topoisomerase 1